MNLTLEVWRQKSRDAEGAFAEYPANDISPDASFLEMLDVVNERLTEKGEDPIHFEHDCREGICGSCGMMINGVAHGPLGGTILAVSPVQPCVAAAVDFLQRFEQLAHGLAVAGIIDHLPIAPRLHQMAAAKLGQVLRKR